MSGVSIGETTIMFNVGGTPSSAARRAVDIYVTVAELHPYVDRLRGLAAWVEDVHETEYGLREFIVRDCNRIGITFGQPVTRLGASDVIRL